MLRDLEPATMYEVRIASLFNNYVSRYSNIQTFITPEVQVAACGEAPALPIQASTKPLITAMAGQYWQVGDFSMQVRGVRGGDGVFSGWGVMSIPYLSMQAAVKFDNVWIDEDYNLVKGEVIALSEGVEAFQKRWEETVPAPKDKEDVVAQQEGQANPKDTPDDQGQIETATVTVAGDIAKVYVNEQGQVVAIDSEGNEAVVAEEVPAEGKALAVADSQGNSYSVDSGGSVSQSTNTTNPAMTNSYALEQRLLTELLQDFDQKIDWWLENNEKGPLDEKTLRLLQALPQCLPPDSEELIQIKVIIEDLQENIEDFWNSLTQESQQWFTQVVQSLDAEAESLLSQMSEEDQQRGEDVVCEKLNQSKEENTDYEGFLATVQGDTVKTDQVYIINGSQSTLKMAYYAKSEDTVAIKFKVLFKEEGATTEVNYPAKDWKKGERNKEWIVEIETLKEGKYEITYKIDNNKEVVHEFWVRHQHYDFACKVCGRDLKVTHDRLTQFFENSKTIKDNPITTDYFKTAVEKAELNTCYRQAHFFSQIAHESKGM